MIPRLRLSREKSMDGKIMSRCKTLFGAAACAILIAFAAGMGPGLQARSEVQAGFSAHAVTGEASDAEIKQMLSIAEAQHEIVKVLIAQGRYDRVLPEMRKILDLKLPEKFESAVAQSASLIANALAENRQASLGHEVINEAQKRMKLNENKASLLKVQAYIYKTEGNLEMALRSLERAVELEKMRTR